MGAFLSVWEILGIWCFGLILVASGQDGSWTEWTPWSPCSVSCGQGLMKQFRTCDPPPKAGGKWCPGPFVKKKECIPTAKCPLDGNWSSWSPWTECTVTCGEGTRERFRSCSDPIPEHGGKDCQGTPHEKEPCLELQACPRDGQWSSWSAWTQCSVTCGEGGSEHRYRSCNDPPPRAGGRDCEGPGSETRKCRAPVSCPINGQWSEWSMWSACSVTCSQGERRRFRECDNPLPLNGGLDCDRTEAEESQIESCMGQTVHCPVDGGWSEWSSWGSCNSPACHSGDAKPLSMRQRSCNYPVPEHGGSMCQGRFLDAGLCMHPINCVVDGKWSEWSDWSCEGQNRGPPTVVKRNRTCNNPRPSNGGKKCPGKDVEFYTNDDEFFHEKCGHLLENDDDVDGSGMKGDENEDEDKKNEDENYDYDDELLERD